MSLRSCGLATIGAAVVGTFAGGCGGSGGSGGYLATSTAPGASPAPASSSGGSTAAPASAGPAANTAPVVSALAPTGGVALNMPLSVEASAADDGLPAGTLTYAWRQVSGPGQVTFAAPARARTAVAFSEPGDYVLEALVDDGALQTAERVNLSVSAPSALPAFPTAGFLIGSVDDEASALAYYDTIDPQGERTTLDRFRRRNGLDQNPAAEAVYLNAGDLGFGRRMSMQRTSEGVVMSVTNYANLDDTLADRNVIATVSMEFTPGPAGGAPFTKFYVFDDQGRRVTGADLDGAGFKHVPSVCIACHGGTPGSVQNGVYTNGGDVGAKFLPFDLDTFEFADQNGARRADQEDELRELNRGILETSPSPGTRELIEGWYGGAGLPQATQNNAFVPAGWAGHEELYLGVVAHSCRTCHVRMQPGLDFATAADFRALGPVSLQRVMSEQRMPDARVTFERFWNSNQPALLAAHLDAPALTVPTAIPVAARRVESRLDDNPLELVTARALVFELAFLRVETPTRLLTEAMAEETAAAARLDGLQRGRNADPQAAARLEDRLRDVRGERRALQDRVARDGEAAILAARDRFLRDADRDLQDLARQRGRNGLLQSLQVVRDDARGAVTDMQRLRDALRRVREPVVAPPQ